MRKSTLYISAVLTTFVLAVLFGVVSAYKGIVNSNPQPAAASAPTDVPVMPTDTLPAPTDAPVLTAEQAAGLAAQVMGRTDLASVETTMLNGASVYMVTFLNGDLVYISPLGTILSFVAAPVAPAPAYVAASPRGSNRPRGGGGGTGSGGGGGGDGGGGDDGGGGGDD